jgi:hypothetical protein
MNKNESIEQSLRRAVRLQVPDVYSRVANQPVRKDIEPFVPAAAKRRSGLAWSIAASLMSLALFVFGAWFMLLRVDSTIDLDVNPSIEIQINRLERVISLQPINEDAIPIVSGIGYRNLRLDQVLNAVVGSMYYHGYLESPESAILITVDNNDSQRASELELSVTIEIDKITRLGTDKIFSQTVGASPALAEMAERLGVSRGLMQLILEAQHHHPQISIMDLSRMPISELHRLAQGLPASAPLEEPLEEPFSPGKDLPAPAPLPETSGHGPKPPPEPLWHFPWDDDDLYEDDDDDLYDDDDLWDD